MDRTGIWCNGPLLMQPAAAQDPRLGTSGRRSRFVWSGMVRSGQSIPLPLPVANSHGMFFPIFQISPTYPSYFGWWDSEGPAHRMLFSCFRFADPREEKARVPTKGVEQQQTSGTSRSQCVKCGWRWIHSKPSQ